jgi:WS/DGAT/MGAT family acyltransferase
MLKQLSDQDASFLYAETWETPMHVGSLSLVDLPDGHRGEFFDDFKAHVASRMMLIPFMHARLAAVPLGLDRPFWVEAEHLDLDYHIRHATVRAPGQFADVEALVAQLHAIALDRSRPLWQFTLIDGLASGQIAIYAKIHHAVMDGASSQAMIATLYDPSPNGACPRAAAPPNGGAARSTGPRAFTRPEPDAGAQHGNATNLMRSLLAHRVQQAIRAVQFVPEALRVLTRLALPDPRTLRYRPIARWPRAPTTLLNVGITNQRAFAARTLPLAAVKQIARHTATKVNDVVLAICSGALRNYLVDKGALPVESLTAMIPVAMRDPTDPTAPNHNGLFLCSLASDIADPYERLLAIHRSSVEQKQRFELFRDLPIPDMTLPGVGQIVRWLVALYGHSRLVGRPPLLGNLTISNVPGPATPLFIAGARLVSIFPCSIPFHSQALNITAESYCDRLDVGLIACRNAIPDVAQIADRMASALAALQQAVARNCLPRPEMVIEDHRDRRDRAPIAHAELAASFARVPDVVIAGSNKPVRSRS